MGQVLYVAVAIICIVLVTHFAPKTGIAAPLLLVLLGIGVSFLPVVPAIDIPPELVLAGVLPALLYACATAMPTMDFRRDLTAIGGLSVVLVVISAVVLGFVFSAIIPSVNLATGIALGAIVSPTDAVATSIVRRLGVSPRLVTILEGEALLNDASALVLLRSAIAATSVTVPAWKVAGDFAFAVVVAVIIGLVVGWLGLVVRSRLDSAALGTAISFATPFLAYIPAEELHASGLVSVVAAGLVTGHGAAKYLRPQDRLFEKTNWRTVETLLEGGVFLAMGLQLFGLVTEAQKAGESLVVGAIVAVIAFVGILVIRAGFVASLVAGLAARTNRAERRRPDVPDPPPPTIPRPFVDSSSGRGAPVMPGPRAIFRKRSRFRWTRSMVYRRLADLAYLQAEHLGPREGTTLWWAGMRGVVTLAAAQSLPKDTQERPLLVLIAFGVAAGSLLLQGGTLSWLVRRLGLVGETTRADADRKILRRRLDTVAEATFKHLPSRPGKEPYDEGVVARAWRDVVHERRSHVEDHETSLERFEQYRELRLRVIAAQREALLRARAKGAYSSQALTEALDILDVEQLDVEARHW